MALPFRQRVLSVVLQDLQLVAKTYLQPKKASTAVITNTENTQSLRDLESYEQLSL